MSVMIRLSGVDELLEGLRSATKQAEAEIERIVVETAETVAGNAKRSIQRGPAGGRTYNLSDPNRVHQASAPNQPPMSDTGRLANSIETQHEGLESYVYTPVEYGLYLELGTSRMEARPWLFPALERERPQFHNRLKRLFS